MRHSELNDSMPGLPPVQRSGYAKADPVFKPGDLLSCVKAAGRPDLVAGNHYVMEAEWGFVKGRQMIYLRGKGDVVAYASDRFELARAEPAADFTLAQKDELHNILTASDRLGSGEDKAIQAGDEVNLPSHYARFKIEPIRFLVENFGPSILVGKIVKYSMRYDGKNGLQDIDKAIRCAQMLRAFVAGDPDWWQRRAP